MTRIESIVIALASKASAAGIIHGNDPKILLEALWEPMDIAVAGLKALEQEALEEAEVALTAARMCDC